MKICFKCGVPKSLQEFYKHAQMADGHLNKCIDCTKADVLRHRTDNLLAVQAYDRERSKLPHRVAARTTYLKEHYSSLKRKARLAVSNAVRDGRLIKQLCWCGAVRVDAHHPSYTKPLEVIWLCKKHHVEADKQRRASRG